MSIETLLEAARFVELSSSLFPTRVGVDEGVVVTQKLPASNVRLSTEPRKSTIHLSPPKISSKHLKQHAAQKKKEGDVEDEVEFSSSGNLSTSDLSAGDLSDKRRRHGGSGTRESHNELEKNRRAHLKECFEGLRYQIPNMQDHKVSNLSILRGAFRFVQILKRKEKELEQELDRLICHKIEVQGRLLLLKKTGANVETSDKSKLSWPSEATEKKRVKKPKRKRKKVVVRRLEDDDGASTSTASEAEEEERRSRAHSPVSELPSESKSEIKLQTLLASITSVPRSTGHASVIQSTGQPREQLRVVPIPCQKGDTRFPTAVADKVHGAKIKAKRPSAFESLLASSLRPTVSQLLNTNGSLGSMQPKSLPSTAPKVHIHTSNEAGSKAQASLMATQPKINTLAMTETVGTVSSTPPATDRNGSSMPTMLASALTGHLVHSTIEHRALGNVSQPSRTSSLITPGVGQPVVAALPTQNIFKTDTVRPGLATASLQTAYTQVPYNPAMTQVLLTQPSITAYTISRQVPFSHTIIRQTLTPVSSKYASSSTAPVTIMTTSQKVIVSPKSTSSAASTATNTITKDNRVDLPMTGSSTVVVPATPAITVPPVFPTAYVQAVQPGTPSIPFQPGIRAPTATGPIFKTYHPMYIPRYRTIGSVISRPLVSGVGVGAKLVTQAGNGNTATIIVQPSIVNTINKPKNGSS